jgi:ABC-type bacteriocin/lantibiotic exporter with double-glycine peptidase domain
MDLTTILTPILTVLAVVAWDIVRTFWFARYTARLTAKAMRQSAELHCKQMNNISNIRSNIKLLTTQTHQHGYISAD